MKSADIGFIMHHDSALSKIIAWFMSSKWSHTFIGAGHLRGEPIICETTDFEVTLSPLSKYLDDASVSIVIYSPVDQPRHDIAKGAMAQIGTVYGYLQLLSLGLRRLAKRIGIKIPNLLRQGMVCVHVVLYGYQRSTIPELRDTDPESLDTEDLYQIVSKSSNFRKTFERLVKR